MYIQIKRQALLLMAGFAAFAATAQEQGNLVGNSSFEEIDGKVKTAGQINLAVGWYSATDDDIDLFTSKTKKEYSTPSNPKGEEPPEDGVAYAGVRVWSEKEREQRTYLQTRLLSNMKAGKTYCVKYNISLADVAKYAVNNVGVYMSSKKIAAKDVAKFEIQPQIIHTENKIMNERDGWIEICRTYKALGGEKYLTFGNFAKQSDVAIEKLRRPKGFTQQQTKDSYYYIDNISVINMAELGEGECDCEKLPGNQQMRVVFRENVSTDNTLEDKRVVSLKKVYFDQKVTVLKEQYHNDLDELIEILKNNQKIKVEIRGHSDSIEELQVLDDLSAERAKAVYDYMIENGVPEFQLSLRGLKDTSPISEEQTTDALARNRRVEFKVKE